MLDRRLHTDTAKELWNDLSFIEKSIDEQREYRHELRLRLTKDISREKYERVVEVIRSAREISDRFCSRQYILRAIENHQWMRASGEVVCAECRKDNNRHPNVDGYEWLTVLCDGSLVKL